MLKIYGHPMSTCTRKVLFTLNETNTPYELTVVDFAKGEHKQAAHLAHQPFGQLPALTDGAFEMYESRAMARYIDHKAGGKLTPKDAEGEARMEVNYSLEPWELKAGFILTCQARPLSDRVVVDYDHV